MENITEINVALAANANHQTSEKKQELKEQRHHNRPIN